METIKQSVEEFENVETQITKAKETEVEMRKRMESLQTELENMNKKLE